MAEEYTSPEDRLLKLIKGDKKIKNKALPDVTASNKRTSRIQAKTVNMILIALLALLSAIFLVDTFRFKRIGRFDSSQALPKAIESTNPQSQSIIPEPVDTTALESKDLFRAPVASAQGSISDSSFDKLKDLTLKGIVAGDNPQAIIEDTKNQKSYFMNKGQSINRITVKDILQDRVILEVDGETLELTL